MDGWAEWEEKAHGLRIYVEQAYREILKLSVKRDQLEWAFVMVDNYNQSLEGDVTRLYKEVLALRKDLRESKEEVSQKCLEVEALI